MTVGAILMGYDLVRIGIEDTICRYPHHDEKIESCRQIVEKPISVCDALDREETTSTSTRDHGPGLTDLSTRRPYSR